MKVAIPVDENGKEIPNSASLYTVTGASFSVVDLPVSDPAWSDYSGGIAAQMGIHTGVTSNMGAKKGGAAAGLKDSEKIGKALTGGGTSRDIPELCIIVMTALKLYIH